jgi:hypothetical protein
MFRITPLLTLASCVLAADPLDEVRARFFYEGKPIHPVIIEELDCPINDNDPSVLAIDLATAQNSNQFFDPGTVKPSGWVEAAPRKDGSTYAYRYRGALPSGLLVVQVTESGGGTGRFEGVMLLTVSVEHSWKNDGSPRTGHVLHLQRLVGLGDRVGAVVKIVGGHIHVERATSNRDATPDPLDIPDPLSATTTPHQ